MSGLFALLDDVAALAKLAAASVDDVAAASVKAGSKTAGVIIDDAAVTPKYMSGLDPKRELPIIWRITRGSLFNKLVVLLPLAMLLQQFVPWMITPLLMLGGAYLSFEGAEKVWSVLSGHTAEKVDAKLAKSDLAHLEERNVRDAIRTDFILSAEIMTIALASLPDGTLWIKAAALALIGVSITAMVYGSVALIVKLDDIGLHMAERGRRLTRAVGRGLVHAMPRVLQILSTVGTVAMLWVGGSIIVHGLDVFGLHAPYALIHDAAVAVGHVVDSYAATLEFAVTAVLDGAFGLIVGLVLVPIVTFGMVPIARAIRGE